MMACDDDEANVPGELFSQNFSSRISPFFFHVIYLYVYIDVSIYRDHAASLARVYEKKIKIKWRSDMDVYNKSPSRGKNIYKLYRI